MNLVGRIVVSRQTPTVDRYLDTKASSDMLWLSLVRADMERRGLDSAQRHRRVIVKRSFARDRDKLNHQTYRQGAAPLIRALEQLGLVTNDYEPIFMQVKSEDEFTDVALYEHGCESQEPPRSYIRRRKVRR